MVRKSQMNNRWIKGIVWLIAGIVLCLAVAAMYTSGSVNPDCFYDIGKVYDIPGAELDRNGTGVQFNTATDDFMTVNEDSAFVEFAIEDYTWNYLYVSLNNMNQSELCWKVVCRNAERDIVDVYECRLSEGWNRIDLSGKAFSLLDVEIENQKGARYLLGSLRLQESAVLWQWSTCVPVMLLTAGIYIALSILLLMVRKRMGRDRKICLAEGYLCLMERIRKQLLHVMPAIPEKVRRRGRVACFMLLIFYATYALNACIWITAYKQSSVLYCITLFVIALLSLEDGTRQVHWNKQCITAWLIFWIVVCVSDFIVGKKYYAQGYMFLFVFGFLFYVWARMKSPKELLQDLVLAVQLSFIAAVVFCLLCRPAIGSARYMGIYTNPNSYANYLIPVLAACIAAIEERLQSKMGWRHFVLYAVEVLLIAFFLWKTQSRGAMAAAMIILLVLSWTWFCRRHEPKLRRGLLYFGCCLILLAIPVWEGTEWGIRNIPQKLGTQVIMENDATIPVEPIESGLVMRVYAADTRIQAAFSQRSLDAVSNGRLTYWKEYLRGMNVWGHSYKAEINGVQHDAHNMWLGIFYRYGVIGGICFIYLWLIMLSSLWRTMRNGGIWIFPLFVSLAYLILATLDSLEQPWVYVAWFFAYFSMGLCFTDNGSDKYNGLYGIEVQDGENHE